MVFRIGAESVGEFARSQLEAARNDPRLARNDGKAMIADFWDSLEEAERVRTLARLGLHELTKALERTETELGVRRDSPELNGDSARELQAAWERAEWARAELGNDSPHSNAQALISMNSALDAMVENFVVHWRDARVEIITDKLLQAGADAEPEAVKAIPEETLAAAKRAVRAEVDKRVPASLRPKGGGVERYEKPLSRVGWGAPDDRPLPSDLDAALAELGALRDVLVHRAGRVDPKALRAAPSLRYDVGQLVRITGNEYRTYSAAVRCYASEIQFRGIRSWPEVTDEDDGPILENWRSYVMINA